ncbi:hypothetical protein NP493_354g00043 [Ridgeia piscesae]|uniref:Uncharacterized protein n=1 Tax=Ridgeia piscesae TaxID=27915 RepID=A0AAD9L4Q8_RIDPI|nr:hypothetical protein NP493_354g00043 [Ridgeia piscesae]
MGVWAAAATETVRDTTAAALGPSGVRLQVPKLSFRDRAHTREVAQRRQVSLSALTTSHPSGSYLPQQLLQTIRHNDTRAVEDTRDGNHNSMAGTWLFKKQALLLKFTHWNISDRSIF